MEQIRELRNEYWNNWTFSQDGLSLVEVKTALIGAGIRLFTE